MENTIKKSVTIEKQAVYSKDQKHRYELTLSLPERKGKSILVLCLNPASDDLLISDTTTNYLMNNLFAMGYSTITICNLFSTICGKLTASAIGSDHGNFPYLEKVLERDFKTVLIGYGNTFTQNKKVMDKKAAFDRLLVNFEKKAVELVDKEDIYSRLHTIHPLFAGQRFSGEWKFRKYIIEKSIMQRGGKADVRQNKQKKSDDNSSETKSFSGEESDSEKGTA